MRVYLLLVFLLTGTQLLHTQDVESAYEWLVEPKYNSLRMGTGFLQAHATDAPPKYIILSNREETALSQDGGSSWKVVPYPTSQLLYGPDKQLRYLLARDEDGTQLFLLTDGEVAWRTPYQRVKYTTRPSLYYLGQRAGGEWEIFTPTNQDWVLPIPLYDDGSTPGLMAVENNLVEVIYGDFRDRVYRTDGTMIFANSPGEYIHILATNEPRFTVTRFDDYDEVISLRDDQNEEIHLFDKGETIKAYPDLLEVTKGKQKYYLDLDANPITDPIFLPLSAGGDTISLLVNQGDCRYPYTLTFSGEPVTDPCGVDQAGINLDKTMAVGFSGRQKYYYGLDGTEFWRSTNFQGWSKYLGGGYVAALSAKCGIIDIEGQAVVPFSYERNSGPFDPCTAFYTTEPGVENLILIEDDQRIIVADTSGQVLWTKEMEQIHPSYEYIEGYYILSDRKHRGLVDARTGEEVLPFVYDYLTGFRAGNQILINAKRGLHFETLDVRTLEVIANGDFETLEEIGPNLFKAGSANRYGILRFR